MFISIYFNSILVGKRIDPQGIKVRYLPGYSEAKCMDFQSDISRSVELTMSSSVVHKEKQMFRQKRERNVWLYQFVCPDGQTQKIVRKKPCV